MDEKKLNEASVEAGFKALWRRPSKRKRDLTETFINLLETAAKHRNISYSRLIAYCGRPSQPFLDRLAERGLMRIEKTECDRGQVVTVTGKGYEWLRKAQEVLATVT
jgi:predicted transcriptional regulator